MYSDDQKQAENTVGIDRMEPIEMYDRMLRLLRGQDAQDALIALQFITRKVEQKAYSEPYGGGILNAAAAVAKRSAYV